MNGTVSARTAPGWWPSLVTLDCSACGASWTIDLNNGPRLYLAQQIAQHERTCEA